MRMPYANFKQLAAILDKSIKKRDTPMRMTILPCERVALALRFLVT